MGLKAQPLLLRQEGIITEALAFPVSVSPHLYRAGKRETSVSS